MPRTPKGPPAVSGLMVCIGIGIVLVVVGIVGWRIFRGPSEPLSGMTPQQKAEAIKKARGNSPPAEHRAF